MEIKIDKNTLKVKIGTYYLRIEAKDYSRYKFYVVGTLEIC